MVVALEHLQLAVAALAVHVPQALRAADGERVVAAAVHEQQRARREPADAVGAGRLAGHGGAADHARVVGRGAEHDGAAERPADQHEPVEAVHVAQVGHAGAGVADAGRRARRVAVVEAQHGDAAAERGQLAGEREVDGAGAGDAAAGAREQDGGGAVVLRRQRLPARLGVEVGRQVQEGRHEAVLLVVDVDAERLDVRPRRRRRLEPRQVRRVC